MRSKEIPDRCKPRHTCPERLLSYAVSGTGYAASGWLYAMDCFVYAVSGNSSMLSAVKAMRYPHVHSQKKKERKHTVNRG